MFSGIIEGTGTIKSMRARDGGTQIEVQSGFTLEAVQLGDSIAVNGCCLTVTSKLGNTFWATLSEETMRVTSLGRLHEGATVNLEQALRYGDRVGGHLVQGHVDGVGRVLRCGECDGAQVFVIDVPLNTAKYMIHKGSVAIDGVSLTVAKVHGTEITIYVIPHTEAVTTFQSLNPGDYVNLEVDMVGKYIEKLAFLTSEAYHADERVRTAFRKKFGFS